MIEDYVNGERLQIKMDLKDSDELLDNNPQMRETEETENPDRSGDSSTKVDEIEQSENLELPKVPEIEE